MNKENYIVHKNEDRHFSEHGWLKSAFSFSFANWYDPTRMGFGTLRVINDDSIDVENGFGFHPHQDMEIVTIMLEGELTHKDTMGNSEVIKSGEVQRMSAGTGVLHSEINEHKAQPVKLFQIWIETKKNGIEPSYEQNFFDKKDRKNNLQLLVSPDGINSSIKIHQEAYLSRIDLDKDREVIYKKYLEENIVYVMTIDGSVEVNKIKLNRRDAIGISNESKICLNAKENSDLLIIEIPKE